MILKNIITPQQDPSAYYIKDYSEKRNIFYGIIKENFINNLQVFIFNRDVDEHTCNGLLSIINYGNNSREDKPLIDMYKSVIFFTCRTLSVNQNFIRESEEINNIKVYKDKKKDSFHDRFLILSKMKTDNKLFISEDDIIYSMGNGISALGHQQSNNDYPLILNRLDANTLINKEILNTITNDFNRIINNSVCIYSYIDEGDKNE